jgi:hypothetical protein
LGPGQVEDALRDQAGALHRQTDPGVFLDHENTVPPPRQAGGGRAAGRSRADDQDVDLFHKAKEKSVV